MRILYCSMSSFEQFINMKVDKLYAKIRIYSVLEPIIDMMDVISKWPPKKIHLHMWHLSTHKNKTMKCDSRVITHIAFCKFMNYSLTFCYSIDLDWLMLSSVLSLLNNKNKWNYKNKKRTELYLWTINMANAICDS